jgi:membrane associated rhomboid family serine protease
VLEDPEALERLRDGRPLVEGDRGGIVRQVLRAPARPVVTRLLVVANLAVFAYGIYLASNIGLASPYIQGMPLFGRAVPPAAGVYRTWHACGSMSGRDFIQGQWWRLLTAEWVHFGLPHLLLNMLGLFLVGRAAEAMWGRLRYLAVYLISAWASVCVALATSPSDVLPVAGASGAVCGLMGAEAVWVLCNGRHLPRALRRQARQGIFVNLILVAVIGCSSAASGWGHFGGAAAGAAAALLLQVQRFGPRAARAPVSAAVLLVPLAAFAYLEYSFSDQKFEWRYLGRTKTLTAEADEVYRKEALPLLDRHPTRRDAARVEEVLPRVERMRVQLAELAAGLEKVGPRHHPATEEARQAARDFVAAQAEVFDRSTRCLRDGGKWTPQDEEQVERVREKRRAWSELLAP